MSTQEANLTTLTSAQFTASDKIRVLDGDVSRNISLQSFTESQQSILTALGYGSNASGQLREVTTITTSTIITTLYNVVLCDTSGGPQVITLPTAAEAFDTPIGTTLTIKRITSDANAVTIASVGANLIDGTATLVLAGGGRTYTTIISDGTHWHTV